MKAIFARVRFRAARSIRRARDWLIQRPSRHMTKSVIRTLRQISQHSAPARELGERGRESNTTTTIGSSSSSSDNEQPRLRNELLHEDAGSSAIPGLSLNEMTFRRGNSRSHSRELAEERPRYATSRDSRSGIAP